MWKLFFTCLVLVGCSVYESDARKFLREQGIEYKERVTTLSIDSTTEKHCKPLSEQQAETQIGDHELEQLQFKKLKRLERAEGFYYSNDADAIYHCLFDSPKKRFSKVELQQIETLLSELN